MSNPLGITPFEQNLLMLTMGSSYPLMYAELGIMNNSLGVGGKKIPEYLFRPRLLKACAKGLICWSNGSQIWEHWKERKFKITKHGEQVLRNCNIAAGGDYAYNRQFDGSIESLDRTMPEPNKKKIKIGTGVKRTRADAFQDHNDNVDRWRKDGDPKAKGAKKAY